MPTHDAAASAASSASVASANTPAPSALFDRLLSLDFFRGLTLFLLIGESTRIYERLIDPAFQGTLVYALGTQFHHHPWNGLRFWDLIQPFFMFIVGVAIPFSVSKRLAAGESRRTVTRHAVRRAFLLLLLGWAGKLPAQIIASLGAWALLWSICLWLYRRKILIKI